MGRSVFVVQRVFSSLVRGSLLLPCDEQHSDVSQGYRVRLLCPARVSPLSLWLCATDRLSATASEDAQSQHEKEEGDSMVW